MFELICLLTTLFIAGAALYAFFATRDPLHPAVVMAPLFAYFYGIWPQVLNRSGQLEALINDSHLIQAALVFLASIVALYSGLLHGTGRLHLDGQRQTSFLSEFTQSGRSRPLLRFALVTGGLSVAAYIEMLSNVGGLYAAYSRAKGGGYADSGYVAEAILLSFPAVLVLALAVRASGNGLRPQHIALALIIASPHLIEGTLGGRRGPLFLILATLLFSWFVARGKIPSLKVVFLSISVIGLAIVVVASQRQHLYLGSEGGFEVSKVYEGDGLAPEQIDSGNSYVTAIAMIVAADFFEDYFWGYRYFVTFLVRPIPKQIWPNKYEDMGAHWMNQFGENVFDSRYATALGFALPGGVSGGAIADGYHEFWWGVVLMFYAVGRAFAATYRRHKLVGGFWTILFFIMLALSIYLPTQSFSAWMHRLLFMSGFGYLFWRLMIGRISSSTRAPSH